MIYNYVDSHSLCQLAAASKRTASLVKMQRVIYIQCFNISGDNRGLLICMIGIDYIAGTVSNHMCILLSV